MRTPALWLTAFYFLSFPLMAQKYETQQFKVLNDSEEFELRYYPPVMKIQSANDFGSLFNYISGSNTSSTKIAMTTPVYMGDAKGNEVMEFVLPASFYQTNTPGAASEGVRVFQSNPGYFIAVSFGGYATSRSQKKIAEQLREIAKQKNFTIISAPILLVYNAPFQVFGRKNEVLFEIAHQP